MGPEGLQIASGAGRTNSDMLGQDAAPLQPACVCPLQIYHILFSIPFRTDKGLRLHAQALPQTFRYINMGLEAAHRDTRANGG